jgi:hypothetical protein
MNLCYGVAVQPSASAAANFPDSLSWRPVHRSHSPVADVVVASTAPGEQEHEHGLRSRTQDFCI